MAIIDITKLLKTLQRHRCSVSIELIDDLLSQEKTIPFEVSLFDLLQAPENQTILQQLEELKNHVAHVKKPTSSKKSKKILLAHILAAIKKPVRFCKIDEVAFEQTYYKGSGIESFENEKAWSSLSDDIQDPRVSEHVTNIGVVKESQDNEIVIIRSGKSENPSRLYELLDFVFTMQQQASSKGIFCDSKKNQQEFQHVILSFKDLSLLKRLVTLRRSDNERRSILSLAKAADAWPEEAVFKNDVHIKRPILLNLLFSGTAKGFLGFDLGRTASRFLSFLGNQKLVALWFQKHPDLLSENLKHWFETVEHASIMHFFSNRSFFNSREYKSLMHEEKMALSTVKTSDAFAMESVLFSHESMHVADLFLYYLVIFKALGLSYSVQCKSGLDRTGLAVALSSAAFMFEKKFKKPFLPHEHEMPSIELARFKSYFRKSLFSLCLPVTTESRGEYGLLWGKGPHGNPVPRKYLYLAEDRPFMEESEDVDIENLTYDDLRSKGRRQYKGNFVLPKVFYGKTL